MLGSMYDDGKGVIQDYKESAKWYRKAAEQGHSSFINKRGHSAAQFILAGRYNDGKGVVQDYKESVKWYRKSAEQGYDDAQYNLGVMYYRGTHGVRKDYKESSKWYRKAAEQGHPKAQKFIQVFTKAAGQGNSDALEWMRKYEKEEEGRKNDQAIGVVFIVIFLVCLYFLPSIISFRRNHRNRWLIFLVNLVFGVTVLGWIGSLIWSLNKVDDPTKGGYKTDGQDGDHHF